MIFAGPGAVCAKCCTRKLSLDRQLVNFQFLVGWRRSQGDEGTLTRIRCGNPSIVVKAVRLQRSGLILLPNRCLYDVSQQSSILRRNCCVNSETARILASAAL